MTPRGFSDSEFYISPFMFAVEDVGVLRSKWVLLNKLFSNHLNKTNAQFSSEVITSWLFLPQVYGAVLSS